MAKKEKRTIYIYASLFILFSIIVIWKCRYGYAHYDESFYLAIPYRFLQGDRMLYDEWACIQMEAIPLMPILALYLKIKGNLDGIFLFIRYFYSIVKILFALCLYYRLRVYSKKAAMVTSLAMLLFSAYGLMVLSYNNLSVGGLLVAILCLITDSSDKKNIKWHIVGGVAFSLATIEIPHLAFLFIIYTFLVAIKKVKHIETKNKVLSDMLSVKSFIGMLIGVAGCAILFFGYVFSKITFNNLLQTLPHIVLEDRGHPVRPWYKIVFGYFARIAWRNNHNYFTLICYVCLLLFFMAYIADKKKKIYKKQYLLIAVLMNIILLLQYFLIDGYVNYIMLAPNVLAFFIYFLVGDERIKGLFYCFWIPGMIYSFLAFWASNTGFQAVTVASSVATVGSIMIIGIVIEELLLLKESHYKIVIFCLSAYLLIFVAMTLYYKITYIYWENGVNEQTQLITDGADKGLLVSQERYDYYYGIMEDTEDLRNLPADQHVLYLSDLVLWISGEARFGTYTSSGSPPTLFQYYKEHPDKIPDYVYIEYGRLEEGVILELQQHLGLNNLDEKEHGVILKK